MHIGSQLSRIDPYRAGAERLVAIHDELRARGVVGALRGNLRALSLSGDGEQLLDGIVKDGDRVDVLASVKVGDHQKPVAQIIVRDALVLRAPHQKDSGSSSSTYAATLQLTDAQAERVFYATQNGGWSLMARPVIQPRESWARPQTAESLVLGGDR
jgi:Flp pilus assembly protein CpaB